MLPIVPRQRLAFAHAQRAIQAAALPIFRAQGSGQFVNVASTAAHRIVPTMAVYAATKLAVRTISEGLRQEAGESCESR